MSALDYLALSGIFGAVAALGYILVRTPATGSAALAAALCGGFATFTAATIASEGVRPVWINHTTNMWGIQVWWDLLLAVGIAAFLIAPRARAQGMRLVPWFLLVAATASIGLLAMAARLFWLERSAERQPS